MLGLMQSQVLFGKYETVSHLCQKQQEEWMSSQANPLCASKHSTFNLEIFPLKQQLMCELASNGPFSHCTRNGKGRIVPMISNTIGNENLEWILPLATLPGCKTFIGRLFDHPKSNNSDLILACSTRIRHGTTRNLLRTKSACFEEQMDLRRYWTAVVYDAQSSWSQHNNRCKWSCSPEGGKNLWYQYMGCIVPILLATIWFYKQILPRTTNQRKLITGRHRDKDILSCEMQTQAGIKIWYPFLWKLKYHGQASRQRFPFLWLKKLQQQDKTSLDYWKGWYCSKIDLTMYLGYLDRY